MGFSNKTVIVTGASNGIGRGVAMGYAQSGASVVLADMDEQEGLRYAKELKASGHEAMFVKTDVRTEADILHLMDVTLKTYKTIDILINNAGKALFKPVYELSLEEWDDMMNTNLRSVFLCSREAAKAMRENETGGAIINLASTRAIMSEPDSESYAATKGGIVSLTHALAASLSNEKITVNSISPGWIETGDYGALRQKDHQQHFSNRVGKPEDIARACLYLTAAENDFVTGVNLIVDGGMTRKMMYEE
ncbi:SDR family NAD(P)-dependent oxidoreductase [Bacillus sp. mrc49]|uniref:SDR family NAD(P)-dependent oxidoreductase n=1 Tax=Bacillus sp. mrc49 TaxID=2054913 RepID=UPI000C275652|nr:glucose 1-dehydrogenase [Bacillus sp. mrc49]PJN86668.1 3-ketoacyl-ACP reductase [Bacillus sp. mrc49]